LVSNQISLSRKKGFLIEKRNKEFFMAIPPIGPNANFPSMQPSDPRQEATQINQGIQNDLNKLIQGGLTPGEEKLIAYDLGQKMGSLEKLEGQYPNDFTADQKSITNNLNDQIQAILGQMDPPTPGQLQYALATSEQLHF
jgi:hypothetical protein